MEKQTITPKQARQRKFLLALPILILPFITLLFWSFGGGSLQAETGIKPPSGFNLQLPDANLKEDEHMDKMTYYELAKKDSDKFQEMIKNDLNYKSTSVSEDLDSGTFNKVNVSSSSASSDKALNKSIFEGSSNDPATEKIYSKLAELDKELNKPVDVDSASELESNNQPYMDSSLVEGEASEELQKLEAMMQSMNQSGSEDPELQQLNGMLEKILEIQHPQRAQEKIKQLSQENRGQVFTVSGQAKEDSISLLVNTNPITIISTAHSNGFYSLSDETSSTADAIPSAIQAVIHETQTLVNGSVVKLRLLNDIYINGLPIPKDNFIFGIASLSGERLTIQINSIRHNNSLFPVELAVYDLDGLDGIYIPGAISRDVTKQSADQTLQPIGLTTLDPSWGAQAASAGIEAAKTLLSKKVKLVKVTVKAGYQVLLYDEKQKQNQ